MSWQSPNLPADKHCFFGRKGGVSEGRYASLNLNDKSRDNPENILRNYQIIASRFNLQADNICRLIQGTSADAVYITEPSIKKIQADGAVTDKPGIILSIGTADCAPVLLADDEQGIIGAAHAGWRGAFNGIVENTVRLMCQKGARIGKIAAAIGPCIRQPSYEMDREVLQTFLEQSPDNRKYFIPSPRPEHWLFDLGGYVSDRLRQLGIDNIVDSRIDTYADEQHWFSYRRDTHRGLIAAPADFPVELSTITL